MFWSLGEVGSDGYTIREKVFGEIQKSAIVSRSIESEEVVKRFNMVNVGGMICLSIIINSQ